MKKIVLLLSLLLATPAFAQTTTKPNASNTLSQCSPNAPIVGNGAGAAPICHPTGALQTFNSAMLAATAPAFTGTITGTYTLGGAPTIPVSGLTPIGAGVATALGNATNSNGGFPIYASGSWTPTITTSGTVGTPAYSIQVGTYEQIGRQVTVRFNVALSGWTGSPTGSVLIAGLPFTSANVANDIGICHFPTYAVLGLNASSILTAQINPNTATMALGQVNSTATAAVTAVQAGTAPTFVGMCSYHT